MARMRFQLISSGMREVLNFPGTRAVLTGPAARVLSACQSNPPIDTGEYSQSFKLVSDSTDRAVERVINTADHAMLVEAKTGHMARALGSA